MRVISISLIILYLLPALISVGVYGLAPIWLLAALLLAGCIILIGHHPAAWRRILAALLSWLAALGSVSLITSFDLQGEGFNNRFFFHFTLESLKIGMSTFPLLVAGSGFYMLASFILPWFLPKKRLLSGAADKISAPVLLLLSALVFPPAVSAAGHIQEQQRIAETGEAGIKRQALEVDVLPLTSPPKNLILIYAESLERLYFDEDMFPGLMKNLGPLTEEAVEFTNVHQRPGTGWTIAGIVASQCGLPFNVKYIDGQEANIALAAIDEPFKDEICLADILDAYDYNTVFMGGAKLSFAGKGKFLDANGFDETLGLDELHRTIPDYRYVSKWGLYDDTLLDLAMAKVDELAAKNAPYFLSALTVDTHHPVGHLPKNCEPYPNEDNPILHAIYCNDRIVGDFITRLRQREDMDNTVIVLLSDHLSMKNTVFDRLTAREDERRLSWFIWDDMLEPAKIDAAATHFDVTPTVLELMGIPNYRQNNWGRSVLNGQDGYWHAQNPEQREAASDVSYLDMDGNSAKKGIRIDAESRTIYIGQKPFRATRAGFSMKDSIFMLALDKSGAVSSIMFTDQINEFDRIAKDMTIVAVSLNPALAPGAVLPPKEITPVKKDASESSENVPTGDKTEAAKPKKPVAPLYYYIGTPSKGVSKTGVTDSSLFVPSRQMRRALRHKAIK